MTKDLRRIPFLTNKNYLFAIIAGTLFMGINYILLSFGPVYVINQGFSDFLAGFQNTWFSVFCVIFRFYLGPLADIKGRKHMMMVGSLAYIVGVTILLFSGSNYILILLARMCTSIGLASYLSAASCFVTELVSTKHRGLAIGIQRSGYSVALMLGPIGTVRMLNSPYGFKGLFYTLIILGILALLLVALLKDSYKGRKDSEDSKVDLFGESKKLLRKEENRNIYILIMIVCINYGAIMSYINLYLASFPSIKNPGIYFTFFAISGLIGNVLGGHLSDRFDKKKLSLLFAFIMAFGTILLFFLSVNPLWMVILASTLNGIGLNANIAVNISWLLGITPVEFRGASLGLQESSIDSGLALGSFIFGSMTYFFDASQIFLAIGLTGILIPYIIVRKTKKEIKGGDLNAFSNNERNV